MSNNTTGNTLEGVTKVAGGQTTISNVIRVTAEDFKTPCGGILSTAATTHGAPASMLTPKTLVDHCNTQIDLATAEQLGLVRRDSHGNYIEVPLRRQGYRLKRTCSHHGEQCTTFDIIVQAPAEMVALSETELGEIMEKFGWSMKKNEAVISAMASTNEG